MGLKFKYRCETCGEIFEDAELARQHLQESANEDHIIDEEYINDQSNGVPKQIIFKSPNGTLWTLSVDNNGVLTTEEIG